MENINYLINFDRIYGQLTPSPPKIRNLQTNYMMKSHQQILHNQLVERQENGLVRSLISVNQQLKSKVLDMQSAPRITELAKQRLGMIPNPKAPTSVTP